MEMKLICQAMKPFEMTAIGTWGHCFLCVHAQVGTHQDMKVRFLVEKKEGTEINVLEGEAWINLDLPDLILNNLKLLGIRKKRELTSIQKQSLVERLQVSSRGVSCFREEHGQA